MTIHELKQTTNIADVVGHYLHLKPNAAEFVAVCPFHDDKKPSLTVVPKKGIFKCHACGEGGDAFDFVQKYTGQTLAESIETVKEITGNKTYHVPQRSKEIITPDASASQPFTTDAETVYHYSDTVKVTRDADKKIRPYTFSGGKWIAKAPTNPPPYIVGSGPMILVEGEKTADAVAAMGYTAVTWMGGTNRWNKTDLSFLTDDVLFWPDNDEPGRKCMQAIAEHYNISPKWIPAPQNAPKGWDAADGDTDGLIEQAERKNALNFVPVGYSKHGMQLAYYFYIVDKNQVTSYTNAHLTKSTLRELHSDLAWWAAKFPHKNGVDVDAAVAHLINLCTRVGLFDADKIRNRGAWMDDGRVVVHTGQKLIVDGTQKNIAAFDTEYIYERRKSINFKLNEPITADQGAQFVDALRLYNWERAENAELLAGWCFVAPICGALNWRPHIWVSGSSGVGKTKLMKDTVWQLLEDIAITPEGESTEAGIRQTLDGEALPVLFDEVEADTREAQMRMDGILNLMRSASSGKSGQIMKGGATHAAKSFRIRSCFAFSSIVYQATKKADRSRITVLGLTKNSNHDQQRERWDQYNKTITSLIDDKFIAGFRSRAVQLLPQTIEAAATFAEVVGVVLSDRRLGDQIGTMVAGCWMLQNDFAPTKDEAEQYIAARNLYDDDNDEMDDELQLLRFIMQQSVQVETDYARTAMTIGELIYFATQAHGMTPSVHVSQTVLGRCGIAVQHDEVYIANSSHYLTKILSDSQWSKNHHKILRRINGAQPIAPYRFTQGNRSRATAIPLNKIL